VCARRTIVLKVGATTLSCAKVGDIFDTCIKYLNTVDPIPRLKYLEAAKRTQSLFEFSKWYIRKLDRVLRFLISIMYCLYKKGINSINYLNY